VGCPKTSSVLADFVKFADFLRSYPILKFSNLFFNKKLPKISFFVVFWPEQQTGFKVFRRGFKVLDAA